jgi:AcrR family transcriptional regulator
MARPVSIKDETIIEAAKQVFLERGIQATTAEVAARAGVSEGSVFKRFRTKLDLFRAAMEDQLALPDWTKQLSSRVGVGEVQDNLFEIGMGIIVFFREMMPLMMMAWSNPGPNGLPGLISGPNPPPVRALKKMTAYFDAEMRAGRLREHDAEIAARSFVGSLQHFVFFEVVHRESGQPPVLPERFVRGLVDLLWAGVSPPGGAAATRSK